MDPIRSSAPGGGRSPLGTETTDERQRDPGTAQAPATPEAPRERVSAARRQRLADVLALLAVGGSLFGFPLFLVESMFTGPVWVASGALAVVVGGAALFRRPLTRPRQMTAALLVVYGVFILLLGTHPIHWIGFVEMWEDR